MTSGVSMVPPPPSLREQIEKLVREEGGRTLKPGEKGAFIAVTDKDGVNIAVAVRTRGDFEVQGWFAKKWSGDMVLNARVIKTW